MQRFAVLPVVFKQSRLEHFVVRVRPLLTPNDTLNTGGFHAGPAETQEARNIFQAVGGCGKIDVRADDRKDVYTISQHGPKGLLIRSRHTGQHSTHCAYVVTAVVKYLAVDGVSQKLSELGKNRYLVALVIRPEAVVFPRLPVHDESTYEVIETPVR